MLAGILLGDLQFHDFVGVGHRAQQGRYRFTNLEVHRTAFDLQNNVVIELPILWRKVVPGGTGAIGATVIPFLLAVVDKAAPIQQPTVFIEGTC